MRLRPDVRRFPFVLGAVVGITFVTSMIVGLSAHGEADTYRLTNLQIEYPFDPPGVDLGVTKQVAGVKFQAVWPASGFPGGAECTVTLSAADDTEAGSLSFGLVSASNGSAMEVEVPVATDPKSAKGDCVDSGVESATGAGYVFTASKVKPVLDGHGDNVPDRALISFDIAVATPGAVPGLRTCYLSIDRVGGTTDAPIKYNVMAGDAAIDLNVGGGGPETIEAAHMECKEFEP